MKKIYIFISKTLICIIVFLLLGIISKSNSKLKERINYQLYKNHLSFSQIRSFYNHYLGGIIPLENISSKQETAVFKEKLNYTESSPYLNGVSLKVSKNYLVPNQEAGTVVYIGEKENYGNVIIINGKENVDRWYGNICNTTIKLYDYLEEGNYLGETCNDILYLAYEKDNKFLDYKNYLS